MVAWLNALTNNDTASDLLERIIHYCNLKNGGVVIDGRRWSYRSVADWAIEIHASFDKAKRALKLLREAGLVQTMMAWAGKKPFRVWVLHVTITVRTELALKGLMHLGEVQICTDPKGKTAPPPGADLHLPLKIPGDLPGDHLCLACARHSAFARDSFQLSGRRRREEIL
jgi:hypothetical protein